MHKLTSKEADRVVSVLDGSLAKLNVLAYVPEKFDGALSAVLSKDEVKESLERQWRLEAGVRMRGSIADEADLHESTRSLCRVLQKSSEKNRSDLDLLFSSQKRSETLATFNATLNCIADVYYRKLSTTVERSAYHASRLEEVREREKKAEEEKKTLEQALQMNSNEFEKEGGALEQLVEKFQVELQSLTDENARILSAARATADEQAASTQNSNTAMREKLGEQILALKAMWKDRVEQNRATEALARKKRSRLESELASQMERYDTDMLSLTEEITELRDQFAREKEELAILTEYFDRIDANARKRDEEEAIISQLKSTIEFATRGMNDAASRVQAIFRGNRTRRELLATKKKGKGSKGKGKKKKK